MKISLLSSGQGSQYVGMLKDIYENVESAKKKINIADEILGYSLSSIMFEGPIEKLKETRYTQPALFLHSSVLTDLIKNKVNYSAVAGHSVGEYAALYAAGALSFEEALKLVSLRGELMFKAGEYLPGTMFAIIGLEDEKVVEICKDLTDKGNGDCIVAANFNSPGQIVVSGSADYLRNNVNAFKEAGAKMVTELIVSGAFHSPLMEPAKKDLEQAILKANFSNTTVPVYTNVFAKPTFYKEELRNALILQLTSPVLWTQTLLEMQKDGFDTFTEVGAGKVLQGLVKRTLKGVTMNGYDKFDDVKEVVS
ncbi:MAG TPA: ACP S-malonyltransferase [Candidatus Kapabacteria bacterium]|nr:ACP S-malonyltransferase [Candidatus Kapabacteria bacterium]